MAAQSHSAGEQQEVLDLSGQGLKKINKPQPNEGHCIATLMLDGNELQRWDNIESYPNVQKLSAGHNQLMRMYGIARLHHIHTLNLSHNCILSIEGLKEMIHLRWLCLAANKIKTIEHLQTNVNLEHLDLSENNIAHVSDLSFLKELTHLFLHGNRVSQLRQCERFLPSSIEVLTLAANKLTDLNEVSHLAHLASLRDITIMNNPCVDMTGKDCIGFDYRPFLINWCMSLKVIDGFVVDPIESLKAEWLYSQGRGRQFRVGEHSQLAEYLSAVCPLAGDSLESEEERKLQLILSKAQHHQQQLKLQQNDVGRGRAATVFNRSLSSPAPSPALRRRVNSVNNSLNRNGSPSPRRTSVSSRLPVSDRVNSPDRMAASLHASITNTNGDYGTDVSLMTRSLDPFLLFSSANGEPESSELVGEEFTSTDANSGALQGASKLVPVPESLMSPEYRQPVIPKPRPTSAIVKRGSPKPARNVRPKSGPPGKCARAPTDPVPAGVDGSSDEDSECSTSKLDSILKRAQQRRLMSHAQPAATAEGHADVPTVNGSSERAALCIQKMWRGYRTRNVDRKVVDKIQTIQMSRTNEYIQKLSSNMEHTIAALESERKLQMLQMQAINALWKKLSSQPTEEGQTIVNLAQTCSQLHNQVSQLQTSINGVMQRIDTFCRPEAEAAFTQTDIVAVHTPQSESVPFPYQRPPSRPSSLPLPCTAPEEVQQFATSLVDVAFKTVAVGDDSAAEHEATCRGELLSLEENSSSIMIVKQPPSSLNTPLEPDPHVGNGSPPSDPAHSNAQ